MRNLSFKIALTVLMIAIVSSGFSLTNRWVSDNTHYVYRPDGVYQTAIIQTPRLGYGDEILPKSYAKIAASPDNAQWIGVDPDERCDDLDLSGYFCYYQSLGEIIPSGCEHSRITFWGAADDSIRQVVIYNRLTGAWQPFDTDLSFSHIKRLVRVDLTDADITAGDDHYTLFVWVKNVNHSRTGLIYYFSADYHHQLESFHFNWDAGWALHSLPFKPNFSLFPTLNDIFPDATLIMYRTQVAPIYVTLDGSAPLTGELGDIVRSHSIFVNHNEASRTIVNGWPIFEQRFLDIRPSGISVPPVSKFRYPGTVWCAVPFDCTPGTDQPDDDPDKGVSNAWRYNQSISNYSSVIEINSCFTSPRGIGYMIKYGYVEDHENRHLDLRCTQAFTNRNQSRSTSEIFAELPEPILASLDEWDYDYDSAVRESTEVISPTVETTPRFDFHEPMPYPPGLFAKAAINQPTEKAIETWTSPNPFNSAVEIHVSEPLYDQDVSIAIFDISGKEVRQLSSENNGRSFRWNGKNNSGVECPTGAYYYRVNYGDKTLSGSVLFVK